MTYEDSLSLKAAVEGAVLELSGSVSMPNNFLRGVFEKEQYDFVIDFLKTQKVNLLSKEDTLSSMKKLSENLGQIKPVDLTLTVQPDEKFEEAISNWFSKNIKLKLLPRISIDPSVVGGARITYSGILLDLSLRNKIDELPIFKRKI